MRRTQAFYRRGHNEFYISLAGLGLFLLVWFVWYLSKHH